MMVRFSWHIYNDEHVLLTSHHDTDVCCKQLFSQLTMQSVLWSWTHLFPSDSPLQPVALVYASNLVPAVQVKTLNCE